MELTIKGLKTMNGHDGLIFQCSIYVNGRLRFVASNDGNGGCNLYDPIRPYAENREWMYKAEAWAKEQPEHTCNLGGKPFTYPCDLDCIIGDLIDAELDRRWLKGQCRTKTLFRLPDAKSNEWMVVKSPFSDAVKDWVVNNYPGAVIANETLRLGG